MLALASILLALAVPALSKPRVTHNDLANGKPYTFDEYLVDFRKQYPESQYDYRKTIFEQHLQVIREHNQNPEKTFYMHVNDFTDLHPEEFRRSTKGFHHELHAKVWLNNFRREEPAPVDHDFLSTLPKEVDWRKKGVVTPVKNQGGCGSCWAFSTAETVESHLAIATGKLLTLSEQQLVACVPNPEHCGGDGGCDGATQPLAFSYIKASGGLASEEAYPYKGVTDQCNKDFKPVASIKGQVDLPANNYTALMEAIANVGPISISLDAGGIGWQLYGGGVLKGKCGADIDHAVQLVGYGTDEKAGDYWIVRNSWGPTWGEQGFIRIARDSQPQCATDTTPQHGFACNNDTTPITVCGECGILSASSYPVGAYLL